MRLLLDENISRAVSRTLADQGHQVSHVLDLGLGGKPDPTVFRAAQVQGAVLCTGNRADFELLVTAWSTWGLGSHSGLILPRRGHVPTTGEWIETLEQILLIAGKINDKVVYF